MLRSIWNAKTTIVGSLILAFFIVQFGSSQLIGSISQLSQEVISLVVGVVIAAAGIQYGAIGSIYSYFREELAKEGPRDADQPSALRKGMRALDTSFDELRENTVFLLLVYAFSRSMMLSKSIDLPVVIWPIQHPNFTKEIVLTSLELTGIILSFLATVDSVRAMFSIMNIYRNVSLPTE